MDVAWFKARKQEVGVTDAALADVLGVERSVANKVVNGKVPMNPRRLEEVAKLLEVEPEELLFRIGLTSGRVSLQSTSGPSGGLPADPPLVREHPIALRQVDLAFSMGDGANIDDYVEEGALDFDAGLLRSITRSPPERLFVARGAGDSMMPTLLNDDMVVIDTLQRQLNMLDRIWAISVHGAGAIKRLRAIGKQRILVISDNHAVDNQEVDAEDLRILGRVVWVGRRV